MTSLPDLPVEILFRMFELSPDIIPGLTSAYRDAYDLIYGGKLQGEDFNKYLNLLINNSRKHISNEFEEGDVVLNNLKHGIWKRFAISGEEIAEISYRLGKLHGKYNTESYTLTYNNGILDGPVTYTQNDIYNIYDTQYIGQFAKGLPVGDWTIKNPEGSKKYIYHNDNRVVEKTEKDDTWIGEHFYDELPRLPKDFSYHATTLPSINFRRTQKMYQYFSKMCSAIVQRSTVELTYGKNINVSKQTINYSNSITDISCIPDRHRHLIIPSILFKDGTLTDILFSITKSRISIGGGFEFDRNATLVRRDIPFYKLKKSYSDNFTYLTYYDEDEDVEVIKLTLQSNKFIRCEIPNMYVIDYINSKFIVKFMGGNKILSTIIIDNNSLNIAADDIKLKFGRKLNIMHHSTKRTEGWYKNYKLINLSFDNIFYTYKNNDMVARKYDDIVETFDNEILVSKEISGKKKIFYRDGKIIKIISYDDNGEIKSEKDFTYINGKKIKGVYKGIVKLWVYYADDTLAEYTEKNNIENSITNIRYRKDGTVSKISKFKDGKIIRNDRFDEAGDKI